MSLAQISDVQLLCDRVIGGRIAGSVCFTVCFSGAAIERRLTFIERVFLVTRYQAADESAFLIAKSFLPSAVNAVRREVPIDPCSGELLGELLSTGLFDEETIENTFFARVELLPHRLESVSARSNLILRTDPCASIYSSGGSLEFPEC